MQGRKFSAHRFAFFLERMEHVADAFYANESLDSKTMFYNKDCQLNNLIKILLNNYTAVGCLMKCFQCGLNVNSKSIKLCCALCVKQPQEM